MKKLNSTKIYVKIIGILKTYFSNKKIHFITKIFFIGKYMYKQLQIVTKYFFVIKYSKNNKILISR